MNAPLPKRNTLLFHGLFVMSTRALLLFVFTYTLITKLNDIPLYKLSMESQPFPLSVSRILVWMILVVEGLISLSLLFNKSVKLGLALAAIILASFTIYIGLVVFGFYQKTPCPCGGMISGLNWTEHLILNLFFLIITIISLRWYKQADTSKNIAQSGEAEHLYKPVGTIFKKKVFAGFKTINRKLK